MVSTMLDGVLARSFFLKDFDMHDTVEAFKQAIMLSLGLRANCGRTSASSSTNFSCDRGLLAESTMRPILIVQNDAHEGAGQLNAVLAGRGQ